MIKYEEMKSEIKTLVNDGVKLCQAIQPDNSDKATDLPYFLVNYEIWYSKALATVNQILPDRVDDFVSQYKTKQRKEINHSNYTISDALRATTNDFGYFGPTSARFCMLRQVNILKSCLEKFDSKIYDLQVILQADIFDSELESAKHLLKMGFLRAAGAVCGVVIEKHFSIVCKNRGIKLTKKNPTIADYNDKLKDVAYDTIEWRRIQRLGDLRNLCDHNKDREPTKEEVDELISGTERVTKTIF